MGQRKVEKCRNPGIFCRHAGTYCLNLTISDFFYFLFFPWNMANVDRFFHPKTKSFVEAALGFFLVTKWAKFAPKKNCCHQVELCSALLFLISYIWRLIYPTNTGDFIISSDSSCNKPRKGEAVMLVRPFLTICSSLTVSTSFSNERVTFCFLWEGVFCGVLLRDEGVEFFGCRNGSFD